SATVVAAAEATGATLLRHAGPAAAARSRTAARRAPTGRAAGRADADRLRQPQVHRPHRVTTRGVAAVAERTVVDHAVVVVIEAGRDGVGRARLCVQVYRRPDAVDRRDVDHGLDPVPNVLARWAPFGIRVQAVRRQRRGAVGVIL